MYKPFFLLVCTACFLLSTNAFAHRATNDAEVSRLRSELTSRGVSPLPDPPKTMGAHTACVKHGRSCPDEYVTFLEELLRGGGGGGAATPPPQTPKRTPAAKAPHEAGVSGESEVQLENMRRLRNVLRERLAEETSPEAVKRCTEMRWLDAGLRVALGIYRTLVLPYWPVVMQRLLPCTLLTALLAWVFFGDKIPLEHLRCLLSPDPTFLVNDLKKGPRRSISVAELVMERESFNMSGSGSDWHAAPGGSASTVSAQDLKRESHRRNRWAVTRFALLEAHSEVRPTIIVAKLRLVASAMVLALLLWTLLALPLRVADAPRGGDGGVVQRLLLMMLPTWLSTSAALYLGWTWIGGMVAYAAWEVLAAVDAMMRVDERAAALHEQILQRWRD